MRFATAIFLAAVLDSAAIPDTITTADGRLAWISARSALDESGRLNTGLVDSPLLRQNADRNQKRRATATDACETYLGAFLQHAPSTPAVIVTARVVAIDEGFLHNLPGSLMRLSGTATKGTVTEELYLFYPIAHIRTADGPICARPVGQVTTPAIGDEIMINALSPGLISGNRTILQVDPAREIVRSPARRH